MPRQARFRPSPRRIGIADRIAVGVSIHIGAAFQADQVGLQVAAGAGREVAGVVVVQAGEGVVVLAGVAQVEGGLHAVAVRVFQGRGVAVGGDRPRPDRLGQIAGRPAQIARGVGEIGFELGVVDQPAIRPLVDHRQMDVVQLAPIREA
ncbi:hypothetical protein BJL95_23410 [Methylomonas sp. LWB]|nr:hypothetical protein BJL95_23410 [Methylomonas sp. LWB]